MESSYKNLATVIGINGVIMFLFTYAMIDRMDHFYVNINRIYMALLMVAPMVVLNPEIIDLCGQIVTAQEEEISQMKDILQRLDE